MEFWKIAYEQKWIGIEVLKQAVITKDNPYGDITKEQFEEITSVDFEERLDKLEDFTDIKGLKGDEKYGKKEEN